MSASSEEYRQQAEIFDQLCVSVYVYVYVYGYVYVYVCPPSVRNIDNKLRYLIYEQNRFIHTDTHIHTDL
jgi:hypothetical protein